MSKLSYVRSIISSLTAFFLALPFLVSAHEAYVLNTSYFWGALNKSTTVQPLDALRNPSNLLISCKIAIGIIILLGASILFRRSSLGQKLYATLDTFAKGGSLFLRLAIAISLFFSALYGNFLAPELSLAKFPLPELVRLLMFIMSFLLAIGLFTEYVALLALGIYALGLFEYGPYLISYLNYVGELIVLILFGSRDYSLDKIVFGAIQRFKNWRKYEIVIIRVCYGVALTVAAITIKILHPEITLKVATDWNLSQFHLLFPSDPLLITLGAGIVELMIGLFIIFGFQLRLTVLVTLFYFTLSLIYFREMVWPHLLLYGLSISLLTHPETFSIDNIIFKNRKSKRT